MNETTKGPAAVVIVRRGDGRVLALTRGDDFADWHLPGGKVELGESPPQAAARELLEETGLVVDPADLQKVTHYMSRSGRPVRLYLAPSLPWVPDTFPRYPAGQPAWVPPALLLTPWCSFNEEAATAFREAGILTEA